jgi:hypothetical protein
VEEAPSFCEAFSKGHTSYVYFSTCLQGRKQEPRKTCKQKNQQERRQPKQMTAPHSKRHFPAAASQGSAAETAKPALTHLCLNAASHQRHIGIVLAVAPIQPVLQLGLLRLQIRQLSPSLRGLCACRGQLSVERVQLCFCRQAGR